MQFIISNKIVNLIKISIIKICPIYTFKLRIIIINQSLRRLKASLLRLDQANLTLSPTAQVTRTIHESLVGEPGVEAAGKSRTTPQVFCEQLDITTVPSELLVEEIKNILTEHQDSPLETEQLTDVVKRLSVLGINEEPALGLSVAIFILGSRNFKDWETTRATMTSDGLISSAGVTPEALTVWQKQYSRMNKGYHDEASTSLEAGFYYPSSHEK